MAGQVVQEQLAGLEAAVPRAALKGAAAVAVLEVAVPAARQVGQAVGLAVTMPRGPNVRAAPSES